MWPRPAPHQVWVARQLGTDPRGPGGKSWRAAHDELPAEKKKNKQNMRKLWANTDKASSQHWLVATHHSIWAVIQACDYFKQDLTT